jgi:hypothetical protein
VNRIRADLEAAILHPERGFLKMNRRTKLVPEVMMAVVVTVLFALALPLPIHAQEAKPPVIQMANLLANIQKGVDAKKAKPGDVFTAKTVTPATLNDGTAIPPGSILEGHVDSATKSEHHSDSTLVVTIDKLRLKDGKVVPVKVVIVKVSSLLPVFGGGGKADDQHFDRPSGSAPSMMPGDHSEVSNTGSSNGPHPVEGLTVTSAVTESNSGTFTQKKNSVRLTDENQLEVSLAVVPAGTILQ